MSSRVHAAAPTIHGDTDAGVLERAGEVEAGKLTALVSVEDLWPAVAGQRFVQRLQVAFRDRQIPVNADSRQISPLL